MHPTNDQRLENLRQWLRFHGDYDLQMTPWGSFGCWWVTLTYPSGEHRITHGATLAHRLDDVERWTREIDPNPLLTGGLIEWRRG